MGESIGIDEIQWGKGHRASNFLMVIAEKASQALHVVDRFHVVMNLNKAVDQVRREESGRLR